MALRKVNNVNLKKANLVFSKYFCNNIFINTNKRYVSSNYKIGYLKEKFSKYAIDLQFSNNEEYTSISNLKKISILIPISINDFTNRKGNSIKKSVFIFTQNKINDNNVCFSEDFSKTVLLSHQNQADLAQGSLTHLATLCPLCLFDENSYLVTPIIAYYDKKSTVLNSSFIEIPTRRFLSDHNHQIKHISNQNGDFLLHSFHDNFNAGNSVIRTSGVTASLCILVSSMIHSKCPKFYLWPKQTSLNYCLETYLLKKLEYQNANFTIY